MGGTLPFAMLNTWYLLIFMIITPTVIFASLATRLAKSNLAIVDTTI
jgi:hypothetical protein